MKFLKKILNFLASPPPELPEMGSIWIHNPNKEKYTKDLDLAKVVNVSEVNNTVTVAWYRLEGELVTPSLMKSSTLTIPVNAFYEHLPEEYKDHD